MKVIGMRESATTQATIEIEIQGHEVKLSRELANHDLEDGLAALLNTALLAESNLND